MFVARPSPIAARDFIIVACLALLAGCKSVDTATNPLSPTDSQPTAPTAPGNLVATAGNAQASLTWSASSGAMSYNVKRSTTSGGPYTQLAADTSPSYTDSTVSNGVTYFYVVSAVDSAGESADSAPASVTPDPAVTAPAIPTGLAAMAGNAQATLTWSASSGATSYHVKRATTSGGPYTQVAAPTSATYTDTSLTNGTTYFYVVSAVDSAGESANSAQVSATPAATATIPATPVNLAATPGNAQVSLTWSASTGATSYHVKRATTSGGPYTQVAAPASPAYTDTSLTNGTTYFYVVSAVDSAGESASSAQVSAKPVASVTIAATPTGLAITPGNAQASLTWSAGTGATSYHVKRATTSGGPYTQVAAPTSPTYTDTSLTNGTAYYYVVSAVNSAGESGNSAQVSATPAAPAPTIPAIPTGLAASPGDAQASLTWTATGGATSYHVKRATTSGGPYTQIAAPTSNSYTDNTVTNGTTYYYVVSAVDSAGESANSAQVSALPAVPTPPPTTFGTWINVTPAGVDPSGAKDCGNYGANSVMIDPANPSNIYMAADCQGVWKSTDYGQTWNLVSTGRNGATTSDGACSMAIGAGTGGGAPSLYRACIRGGALPAQGFWQSTNGGVDWTQHTLTLPDGGQDAELPAVDPYNNQHVIMVGHEQNWIGETTDGGATWRSITIPGGMIQSGGSGTIGFVNTGSATTTGQTWLWAAQGTGGIIGTWRTTNAGASWTRVDGNEKPHGGWQIYQPDTSGLVYMAGIYSALGWGVLRSTDYGQTWTHEGPGGPEAIVFGTSKNIYSMYGWAIGAGGTVAPNLAIAAVPGTGTWTQPTTPTAMSQGPSEAAVTNDGTHNIIVIACFNAGLWRYVEP